MDTIESVDSKKQLQELEEIQAQALGKTPTDEPVLDAFQELIAEYDLSRTDIETFIDAMISDIDHERFDEFAGLEAYMRGSAVAVGNMMVDTMEIENPETAKPHASALAEAFQLTNFLRDVREDITDYGRVYLPGETLDRFGVTVDQLATGKADDDFRRVMQIELSRTETRYFDGVAGIQYLPADCQFGVLLAAVLYADHHRIIRKQNFDVLSKRPTISTRRKLYLAAKTRIFWSIQSDPETVFRRVTSIEAPSEHSDDRPLPARSAETP